MWAVVPLKSPERAKTRLSAVLTPAQRRHLSFALAERVIDALHSTRGIDVVSVVTASPEIASFARSRGAQPIHQPDEMGTASAFAAAVRELQPLRMSRLLMIAGDLPLVSADALERLIEVSAADSSAVIVPDRHRIGTNALLCAPPDALVPCFGDNSFQRHVAAAQAAGLTARVLEIDELALDLDSADDLQFLQLHGGMRAARLLASLQEIESSKRRSELGVAVNE